MGKNVLKDTKNRRKSKQKLEQTLTLILFFMFCIAFALYWYFDNDYDDFIAHQNIEELVKEQQYDSALYLLRKAMDDDEMKHIREELQSRYEQIRVIAKNDQPTKDFKNFEIKIEKLTRQLMFDTVIARLERALVDSNYSENDRRKMKQRLTKAKQDKQALAAGDKVIILIPHKVKAGETLNGIAYRYNMKPSELFKINDLQSDVLLEGQKIKVYAPIDFETHTVKSGENLSRIASKYNTTIYKIQKLNSMTSDEVQTGQLLKVRLILHKNPKTQEKSGEKLKKMPEEAPK